MAKVIEKDSKEILFLNSLHGYMKEKKIQIKKMSEELGYSSVHISLVLGGKTKGSKQCKKAIIDYLVSYSIKDYIDLKALLRGTAWDSRLLDLFK